MNNRFETSLMDLISSEVRRNTYGYGINNKLMLGGINGEEGGSGVPWGGVVGRLIQRKVCYDTTEAAIVSGLSGYLVASGSLLDNLNRIRWHQIPVTWFETMPTEPRSMKVHVASGIWYNTVNSFIDYNGATSPTFTIPSGSNRIDVLYLKPDKTLAISMGVESATPVPIMPTTSGVLPLAQVYLTTSVSGIGWPHEFVTLSGRIHKDIRPFMTYPPGAGGGGGGVSEFTGLNDTPADYIGSAGKLVTVTALEDGLEFTTKASIGASIDHGSLLGLGDDDHTQYLKEKVSGGVASEVPTHNHSTAAEAGTVDHGALGGLADDDHSQYLLVNGTRAMTGDLTVPALGEVSFGSFDLMNFLSQYPDASMIDDADHFTTASLGSMWDAWTTTPSTLVDPDYLGHFLRARPSKEQQDVTCFLTTDTLYNARIATLVYSENNLVECGLRVDEGDDDNYIEVYLEATSGAGCLTALWWRYREGGGAVTESQLTDPYIPTIPFAFMLTRVSDTYWQVAAGLPLAYVTGKSDFVGMVPTRSGLFVRNLSGSGTRGAMFHWFTGKSL